jgi:hypothetical protein
VIVEEFYWVDEGPITFSKEFFFFVGIIPICWSGIEEEL